MNLLINLQIFHNNWIMTVSFSDHFYEVHNELIIDSMHFSVFVANQKALLSWNLITQKTELWILLFQQYCEVLQAIELLNCYKMYWQFVLIMKWEMFQVSMYLTCIKAQSNSWIIVYFHSYYTVKADKCIECLWISEQKCQFFNDSDRNFIDI